MVESNMTSPPSTNLLSPRDWLDQKMEQTFSVFQHEPLIDMTDEEIARLYKMLKQYRHRQIKEKQGD